ncbi:MAG: mechanosensitive ion channel [Lachnospiraceae bacterium]|nr:mechanosensitive ion channel [Lachnospiraceae bacterium]
MLLSVTGELSSQEQLLEEVARNPGVIQTYLKGLVPSLLGFLLQLVAAILVLLIGTKIIKLIVKFMDKSLRRSRAEAGVVTFLCSLVKYALYFVLVMIILGQFGVTTSSVVAVLGSAGLTLGLALQGSLANFAGGVLILLLKPFVVGDYIIDGGTGREGTVSGITIFYTKLLTVDNQLVMIPNGALSNSSITNISHMEKRMIDLRIGVSYEADLAAAKRVLEETVRQDEAALKEEPITIFVSDLADSSVQMGVRVWVKNEDYWNARWRITEHIKLALDANGIPIPYPQLDVTLKDGKSG